MRPNNHCIAIISSWGKHLGMGHVQRMTSLLWYLNECKNITAFLLSDTIPDFFPPELHKYVKTNTDLRPGMIIRDMRDSSEDEIASLKKICKVLTLDDNGAGRGLADYAMDILPNPVSINKDVKPDKNNIFLYGYNFLKALSGIRDKTMRKEIDFSIYPGNSASREYIDFLTSLLPVDSDYAVLNGKGSYRIKNGEKSSLEESSYAEIILSSKAVISHFGITLYEGFISGCRLISINPTAYHTKLAETAKEKLHLINIGEYRKFDAGEALDLISKTVQRPVCKTVNAGDVYKKIIAELENFCKLLVELM